MRHPHRPRVGQSPSRENLVERARLPRERLGSTNGTHVNDLVVTEHDLVDGDQIKIGRTILKFMTGSNIEASYHEEIYRMMTFDGLTQIYNKRYFTETLEREILALPSLRTRIGAHNFRYRFLQKEKRYVRASGRRLDLA